MPIQTRETDTLRAEERGHLRAATLRLGALLGWQAHQVEAFAEALTGRPLGGLRLRRPGPGLRRVPRSRPGDRGADAPTERPAREGGDACGSSLSAGRSRRRPTCSRS